MSRTDLEARLVHWLHDGPVAAPRDVVEAALAEARLEGQERVISPPWARLPRLGQIDLGPLVRPAATLVAAAVAIVAVVWLFSYAGLPPAATPSPSASPTISPSPSASLGATPSATAAPAVLPTPVARYVGQATDTRAEGTFTIFQLALDNRASFADEFFADAPEYPCADAVGRRTLVDIRDGDTGGYLRRYCGGYDLQSLTFERAVGQSVVTTVYIELVDQLTGLIERSPSIVIPPPTTPTPGPTLSRSAGPPGWSAPELAEDGPFEDVAMAVDADRNAHLVGASVTGATQNGIVYMTDSSGRWIPEGLTNQVEGVDAQDHDGDVAIAVDPDGTVWVAFTRFGQGDSLQAPALQTFVMRNINGTWSAPVVVAGAGSNSVSMAARGGVLHLAYVVGQPLDASPQQVYYANNSTGAWEAQLISDDGSAPQLRLGADGLPRIAYGTPDGVRLVVMGTDGPEPDLPPGPSAGGADSVLLDVRGDNEYLVWRDIETSVYFHTSRTPIGWTATTAVPVGDVIPDAMVVDGVDESSMQIAGRSEPGGALYVFGVAGPAGSAPLIEGDADDSDLVLSGGGLHVVYAYSGTAQTAGIWFLSHNTE